MSKRDDYGAQLRAAPEMMAFLRAHSGLPGPRADLELVQAAADFGQEGQFRAWIAAGSGNDPTDEFLAVCGVVGLGRLAAEGRADLVPELRVHAADTRWRVREAVAMALQRVGDADVQRLFEIVEGWMGDRPYVQRAIVAGVAEPRLLKTPQAARRAIEIVDQVTAGLLSCEERRSDECRTLRQALAYCWSVVVAADPEYGKPRLERWAAMDDPDIRWMVRENLKKARLIRVAPEWVERMLVAATGA